MTTHQVRQGGLATQQADVAAADIAATVAGADITPTPYHPTLRGLLLTGSEPLYLERRGQTPAGSEAAGEFLWWPPHKVVGRHLGPYLDRLAGGAALGT
jgi:sulfide:quinone oxidoreductase